MRTTSLTFYECFAGGGMARAGLGRRWRCLRANDVDEKKGLAYRANWGPAGLATADIRTLTPSDFPGTANLAWASFPCQDLSLAGVGAGLDGARSGAFWPFWNVMKGLVADRRAPRLIALENVCGALTSHGGRDFSAICDALQQEGYAVGAMVVDAALFLPQSRPRLFVLAVHGDVAIPEALMAGGPSAPWHTRALLAAHADLPASVRESWIWWNIPQPPRRTTDLMDVIEDDPADVSWFAPDETRRLLGMMSAVHTSKLTAAMALGRRVVGCVYRRTRAGKDGRRVQRAEIRFDGVAGCLRTPAGGSSRQVIVAVDGDSVRVRLMSSRETARLMGLPDAYRLPARYSDAYHLTGDGVVVPVVRHLARHIFEPILRGRPFFMPFSSSW